MNEKRMFQIISIIAFIISLGLCLLWYDWKLFVILIIFGTGMNWQNVSQKEND